MRALIQRVKQASVEVEQRPVATIGEGLLIFLGVMQGDTEMQAEALAHKIAHMRLFPDRAQKMNHSLLETMGESLVVSQFTLCADTDKGRRPSFTQAAEPNVAKKLYTDFVTALRRQPLTIGGLRELKVVTGQFAAMMEVRLNNWGPVTFYLDTATLK